MADISHPREFEGMSWLPEPDPHVKIFDILERDTGRTRWIERLLCPNEATLTPLRSSLLDWFPFGSRETKPHTRSRKLWDRRVVKYSYDASVKTAGSTSLPLVRSLGSLSLGASGSAAKVVAFELDDVSVSVAEPLVLLDEHLGKTQPSHVSHGFRNALTNGHIHVVVEACFAAAIRIHDSAAVEAALQAHHSSQPAADGCVDIDAQLSRSATLLFERRGGGPPAAFCIKVRQVNFDHSAGQFFLGKVRRAKVRGEWPTDAPSDFSDGVLQLPQW